MRREQSISGHRPPLAAFRSTSGLSARAAAVLSEDDESNPSTNTNLTPHRRSSVNSDPSSEFVTNPSSYFSLSERRLQQEQQNEAKSDTAPQTAGTSKPLYLPPIPTSTRANNKKRVSFQGVYPPPRPPPPPPKEEAYNVQAFHTKGSSSSSSSAAKKVMSIKTLRLLAIVSLIVLVCSAFFAATDILNEGLSTFSSLDDDEVDKKVYSSQKSPTSTSYSSILAKAKASYLSSGESPSSSSTSSVQVMSQANSPTVSPIPQSSSTSQQQEQQQQDQQQEQQQEQQQQPKTQIPSLLEENLINMNMKQYNEHEIPVFWSLSQSGAGAVEGIFGGCLKLVLASGLGTKFGQYQENILTTNEFYGSTFVNVDLATHEGIERASHLNLVESDLAHVFITPLLHPTISMFTPTAASVPRMKQGRFFVMFRHPIERAVSIFLHLSQDHPEARLGRSLPQTLHEYADSPYVENNPLTRAILDKPLGALTPEDALNAQETLRQKCLVGLYSEMEDSIERFERYFGWYHEHTAVFESESAQCHATVIGSTKKKEDVPWILDGESEIYKLFATHNLVDMLLYKYAQALYRFQGEMFFGAI